MSTEVESYLSSLGIDSNDELMHHGVLGMKWGVRKKAADVKVKNYRDGILKRHSRTTSGLSEKEYLSLSSKKEKLAKKGELAYRVANAANSALNGKTYISLNKQDNDVYAALLDASGNSKAKKSQLLLGIDSDLISPSKRERVDTFIKVLDEDILVGNRVVKGRDFVSYSLADKAMSSKELGLKYYNQFVQSQVHNTPIHSQYMNELRTKGYNALLDDADAGIVTKLPVIVLNSNETLTVRSNTIIDKLTVLEAQENLKDFLT